MLPDAAVGRRCRSSTATRVYQIAEWILVGCIVLQHRVSLGQLWQDKRTIREASPWQALLFLSLIYITRCSIVRAPWLSLLLWTVFFPQAVALVKCGPSSLSFYAINVEISVVSFLYEALQYISLGDWQPSRESTLSLLGYLLNHGSHNATLHVQVIQLGRVLVGSSLNTIEMALISHGLTVFTLSYLDRQTSSMHEVFLFSFLWGLLFSTYPAIPFIQKNLRLAFLKPHHRPKNVIKLRYKYALYAYIIIAVSILLGVRAYIASQLGVDPFFYIFFYLYTSPVRLLLALYWAAVAGTGIIVVVYFWGSKPVGGLTNFPNSAIKLMKHVTKHSPADADDVFFEDEDTLARRARALDRRRKFFHGLVVILFLPTINIDPQFSYLALSLALAAFLIEEVLRACVLPPFGMPIHKFLSGFTDHRDKTGHIVVSHLFLLVGVATPVWLKLTNAPIKGGISMLSGVLTLGVGDAAASIIGKKFGRHKWPTLPKSFEGTAAFITAMLISGVVVDYFDLNAAPTIDWPRFIKGTILTGILEAVSTENDNLIIPVYIWCLID